MIDRRRDDGRLRFEWDEEKAKSNAGKHGVTFEEAATVFWDALAISVIDERHSETEMREIVIGRSERDRLLLVSFTERRGSIRIISARKATRSERQKYEQRSA